MPHNLIQLSYEQFPMAMTERSGSPNRNAPRNNPEVTGARLSILAISSNFAPYFGGGYANRCRKTITALAKRGHSVRVLTSRPPATAHASFAHGAQDWDEMDAGVRVRRQLITLERKTPLQLLAGTVSNRRVTRQTLQEIKPDLIIVFGIDGVGYDVYATVLDSHIPAITSIGDTWLSQARRNLTRFDPWARLGAGPDPRFLVRSAKRSLAMVGKVIGRISDYHPVRPTWINCISDFLWDDLDEAQGVGNQERWVIPLPLDEVYLTKERNLVGPGPTFNRESTLRALFLSRMELLKGPDVAIRAIKFAADQGTRVRLTFAGLQSQELRAMLDDLARTLGVLDLIDWAEAPTHQDVVNLYRRHEVFLFPSRIVEGMGGVNAEAMACGLPVLGTTKYGTGQILKHGRNGLSHEPGDYLTLGNQLAKLAADRALVAEFSERALETAMQHHPDRVIDEWERGIAHRMS